MQVSAKLRFSFYSFKRAHRKSRSASFVFALTVTLTLRADIISQHGTQDEIFLGRELTEWFIDYESDGIETFRLAEKQIQLSVSDRLNEVLNILTFQLPCGKRLILLIERIENHASDSFLKFINVVGKYF